MNPPNAASPFSRYLACFLALILAMQPGFAYADWTFGKNGLPVHVPDFEGQAAEGINSFARPSAVENNEEWTEYLNDALANRQASNVEKIQQSGDDIVELMLQYKDLFGRSLERIDAMIERYGREAVTQRLKTGRVKINDPELGTMEFAEVDGKPVGKIIHAKSGVGFYIYNEDRTNKNSKEFKQYLARQHYDSGTTRHTWKYWDAKGKKKKFQLGRDAILLSVKGRVIGEDGVEFGTTTKKP